MPRSHSESRPPAVELTRSTRVSRANAADIIVEDLRGLIARGVIDKGARLPTERDLASLYQVSPSTVRESMRALAVMGLIEVRHGSGSYVVEDVTTIVNTSLVTAMQMEGVSISELIAMLSLINERAAALAVVRASPEDIAALSEANQRVLDGAAPRDILDGVVGFLTALVAAAHEPLLSVFAGVLIRLLDRIEIELFPPDVAFWRTLTGTVGDERIALIAAIASRDEAAAVDAVRAYHHLAVERMRREDLDSLKARLSDERFAGAIAELLSDR